MRWRQEVFTKYMASLHERLFSNLPIDQIIRDSHADHQKRRFMMMYILQSNEVFSQYQNQKEELGLSHLYDVVVSALIYARNHGRARKPISDIILNFGISEDMASDKISPFEIKEFLKEFNLFVLYYIKQILNRDEIMKLIEMYGQIKDELEVTKMILFGSKVRFQSQKYSDLDILILTKGKVTKEKRERLSDVAAEVNIQFGVSFDTKIYNMEQWESGEGINPKFKENIDREGVEWSIFSSQL